MAFTDWSTNPANNSLVDNINWSEGQLPNTVNGSARQMMADLAVWRDSILSTISNLQTALNNAIPIGGRISWDGPTAPSGWLFCYGQAVSRTTYAALFAIIGTTHGAGDGSTTFNLPDCRGRVDVGKDNMGGTAAGRITVPTMAGDVIGSTGGAQTHTLTTGQLPAHNHGGNTGDAGGHNHNVNAFLASNSGGQVGAPLQPGTLGAGIATEFAGVHSHGIAYEGLGEAHNNVQPSIITNKIIRTGVA
jgi:microcystin-dependent protein